MDEEAETRGDSFSISDVTRRYVKMNATSIRNMGTETWIDCGTPIDLLKAGEMAFSGKLRLGADR